MQARQAVGGEAFAPLADGVAVAAKFGGNLLIRGVIGVSGTQDKSAAQDQRLRGGAGADQGLELLAEFVGQTQSRAKGTWHEKPPCCDKVGIRWFIVGLRYPSVQRLAANLRNGHLVKAYRTSVAAA